MANTVIGSHKNHKAEVFKY